MTPATALPFLVRAGRLLLEYNESTASIHRELRATSTALVGKPCDVAVSYGGIAVTFPGELPAFEAVHELHYNSALLERVHSLLSQIRQQRVPLDDALDSLQNVESLASRHSTGLLALLLGLAASALCALLGGDSGGTAIVGVSTALGLLVRKELGRSHVAPLALPFAAAVIGALLGGFAVRRGWTQTPQLAVMVPALMLVPGAHFLNGLFDLVDNHVPMGMARLGLAGGILTAIALGVVVGVRVTLPEGLSEGAPRTDHLNLIADMLLAGVATSGFAAFYNTPWRSLGLAIVGGMIGHGVRFLSLESGAHLEIATFFGSLTVGFIAARLSRSSRVPVAVVAFAGAVTMMPGLTMFRALGGVLQLARERGPGANLETVAATLGSASQATLAVGALALGLILGARATRILRAAPLSPRT